MTSIAPTIASRSAPSNASLTSSLTSATMRSGSAPVSTSGPSTLVRWTGRLLTALPVVFLVIDAVVKFSGMKVVADTMAQLGWPVGLAAPLGVLLLACTALYVFPRTAALGAVLLTGYLGGAVATHVRVGDPLFSHVLFPIYVGALLWGGLVLRDARVRALIPFRGTKA